MQAGSVGQDHSGASDGSFGQLIDKHPKIICEALQTCGILGAPATGLQQFGVDIEVCLFGRSTGAKFLWDI